MANVRAGTVCEKPYEEIAYFSDDVMDLQASTRDFVRDLTIWLNDGVNLGRRARVLYQRLGYVSQQLSDWLNAKRPPTGLASAA